MSPDPQEKAAEKRAAFEAIVEGFYPRARAIARALGAKRGLAKDVAQRAMLEAWERLEDLKDPSKIEPWLIRIVVNQAKNALRARDRFERRAQPLPEEEETEFGYDARVGDETASAVHEAVASLPEELRVVVQARYFEELGRREIAEREGLSPETVKDRLERAKEALRGKLRAFDPGGRE